VARRFSAGLGSGLALPKGWLKAYKVKFPEILLLSQMRTMVLEYLPTFGPFF